MNDKKTPPPGAKMQSCFGRIREHLAQIEARLAVGVTRFGVIEEFRQRGVDLGTPQSFPAGLYRARIALRQRLATSTSGHAAHAPSAPVVPPTEPAAPPLPGPKRPVVPGDLRSPHLIAADFMATVNTNPLMHPPSPTKEES